MLLKKQRFVKIPPENKELIVQAINNEEIKIIPTDHIQSIID